MELDLKDLLERECECECESYGDAYMKPMIEALQQTLLEKYNFECSECAHKMKFAPSIMMESGINSGHATCQKCKTFLRLSIDLETNTGKSSKWTALE